MKPRKPTGLKAAGTRLWERILTTCGTDSQTQIRARTRSSCTTCGPGGWPTRPPLHY